MNRHNSCGCCAAEPDALKLTGEQVVLVDENDHPIGTALKSEVHTANTPLHQAFSCFIFKSNGDLILQQRASSKITWPNIWSNTCCGHPLPGESRLKAVKRRLNHELGLTGKFKLFNVLPNYRYCATHLGVMENEICPVFVGFCDNGLTLNPDEAQATQEVSWPDFVESIKDPKDSTWDHLSVWCREEAVLLDGSAEFQSLYKKFIQN